MPFIEREPIDAKGTKKLARSILSDREEPPVKEEPEEKPPSTLVCPACGANLAVEEREEADEEHEELEK